MMLLRDKDIAGLLHYPRCWDTMAYPTLKDAWVEFSSWAAEGAYCSTCIERKKKQDNSKEGS